MKFYLILIVSLMLSLTSMCQLSFDNYEKSLKLNNSALHDIKYRNYDSAIIMLLQAIEIDSTNRYAYINLGFAFSHTNDYVSMAKNLEKAKHIFEEDDEIIYYIGTAYQKMQDYSIAIKNYTESINYSKINGEDFPLVYAYYLNRGICYYYQNDFSNALQDFNSAIKFKENNSAIYANRGNTFFKLNMKDKACLDWVRAKELGEKTVVSYIEKYCK